MKNSVKEKPTPINVDIFLLFNQFSLIRLIWFFILFSCQQTLIFEPSFLSLVSWLIDSVIVLANSIRSVIIKQTSKPNEQWHFLVELFLKFQTFSYNCNFPELKTIVFNSMAFIWPKLSRKDLSLNAFVSFLIVLEISEVNRNLESKIRLNCNVGQIQNQQQRRSPGIKQQQEITGKSNQTQFVRFYCTNFRSSAPTIF